MSQALQRGAGRRRRRSPNEVAADYFPTPARQAIGARYLRDNIKYHLGADELAG